MYDGLEKFAMELSMLVKADQCAPSERLLHVMIAGMQTMSEKDKSNTDDVLPGIDLEFEPEASALAPEPHSYETAYVTSHKQACRAGAFSFDGSLVATGSVDASIKILDVERMLAKSAPEDIEPGREQQGHPVIRTLYDHTDEVSYLEFHPKEHILASASRDGTVKLFDIAKPSVKKAHKVLTDCEPVLCVSFHPTGDYIAIGTEHNVLRVYDVQTTQCFVSAIPSQQHKAGVTCVKYSPTAKLYATGSFDGDIKIWDGISGRCINTIAEAHSGAAICSLQFTRNGKVSLPFVCLALLLIHLGDFSICCRPAWIPLSICGSCAPVDPYKRTRAPALRASRSIRPRRFSITPKTMCFSRTRQPLRSARGIHATVVV